MDNGDVKLPTGPLPINDLVGLRLEVSERMLIEATLERHNQNRTKSAEVLGICIRTLRNKLKSYRDADELGAQVAA